MLAALESGTTLVVDRYSYSGMAYTLSKQLPGIDAQASSIMHNCTLCKTAQVQMVHHVKQYIPGLVTELMHNCRSCTIAYGVCVAGFHESGGHSLQQCNPMMNYHAFQVILSEQCKVGPPAGLPVRTCKALSL
jgi:hypothetical protein